VRAIAALFALALGLMAPAAQAQSSLSSYDAVHDALVAIWDELPLTVRNATFTTGAATGYGAYTARPNGIFMPNEQINLYAEILGYQFNKTEDNEVAGIDADLFLVSADGRTLARQDKFTSVEIASKSKRLETYIAFETSLSGFPPGDYVLECRFTDRNSGEVTEFKLKLTISGE
jgi:hypothetical protein